MKVGFDSLPRHQGFNPVIVHLIINMINMYITVPTRTSTAIDSLEVDLLARKAKVTFVNGYEYEYSNVSARAIANVLFNPDISLGFWVNNNCINAERSNVVEPQLPAFI